MWPLLIYNSCCCAANDSHCSNHCSAVLHPFLMSNSHPLHPLFTQFELVVRSLLPVVQGTIPLLYPTVFEAMHFNRSLHVHVHISCIPTPPTIFNSDWRQLQEQQRQDRMDADDAICLVEDLWELQSNGESAGLGSSPTQETVVQQSKKR